MSFCKLYRKLYSNFLTLDTTINGVSFLVLYCELFQVFVDHI